MLQIYVLVETWHTFVGLSYLYVYVSDDLAASPSEPGNSRS